MSPGLLEAWIGGLAVVTAAVISGAYLLKVKRTPEPPPSPEEITLTKAWARLDEQEQQITDLIADRDRQRTGVRILGDGFDALRAAMARIVPPPIFTRGEQEAIDKAAAIRDDDSMWPTHQRTTHDQEGV
jgi:hypothetical protein